VGGDQAAPIQPGGGGLADLLPPGPGAPGRGAPVPSYTLSQLQAANPTPQLWQPHPGIGPLGAIKRFFRKYATFSGRASRSEYWWPTLFLFLITLALSIGWMAQVDFTRPPPDTLSTPLTAFASLGGAGWLYALLILQVAVAIPSLAVSFRRLHDSNHSGAWWLLNFSSLGALVIFVFTLQASNPAGARFDNRP
jgi:uncharacterized membrane protein YhaH (DUF805 family)